MLRMREIVHAIQNNTRRLCTKAGKNPKMIKWADGRAAFWVIPDLVRTQWGIDTAGWEGE
jgi:hypothetical protein